MLLRYKMMPSAGTSPLILLGLQWWPLDPPRGVCPGSASAYRLDEVWVGSSGTGRRVKAPPSCAAACCPGRLGRTASGLGCSTHATGAPQRPRPQWQLRVQPSARAKVADCTAADPLGGADERSFFDPDR